MKEDSQSENHPLWNRPELSQEKMQTILSNPGSELFGEYGAELLESTRDIERVKKYMGLETLARHYDKIRPHFTRSSRSDTGRNHWDKTVEILREEFGLEKEEQTGGGKGGSYRARAIGQRLRRLRESRELTQEELAQKLGWSRHSVSDLERGRRNVSLERIHRFVKALGWQPHLEFKPTGDLLEAARIDIETVLTKMDLGEETEYLCRVALTNLVEDILNRNQPESPEELYKYLQQLVKVFQMKIDESVYEFFFGREFMQEELDKLDVRKHISEELLPKIVRRLLKVSREQSGKNSGQEKES